MQVTDDMHILATKTKQETVSMKIITLVTLFFLPGTFISVSLEFSHESVSKLEFANIPLLCLLSVE